MPVENVNSRSTNPFYVPLEREVVEPLAGDWHFRADRDSRGQEEEWFRTGVRERTYSVPSAWQCLFDDLRDFRGPVWYEREFTVSGDHEGGRQAVVFCGVDHLASIWVNGRHAGTHEGGYLPFAVDVSNLVEIEQPNRLTVRAEVPEDQLEIPGDETGQGHRAGIWRPVWLEVTGTIYVSDIHVIPDIDQGAAQVVVEVSCPAGAQAQLTLGLRVDGPDGRRSQVDAALAAR